MVTPQQTADLALQQWQSLRSLPPEDRIDALMANFFAPPPPSDFEYELTLRYISEIMSHA